MPSLEEWCESFFLYFFVCVLPRRPEPVFSLSCAFVSSWNTDLWTLLTVFLHLSACWQTHMFLSVKKLDWNWRLWLLANSHSSMLVYWMVSFSLTASSVLILVWLSFRPLAWSLKPPATPLGSRSLLQFFRPHETPLSLSLVRSQICWCWTIWVQMALLLLFPLERLLMWSYRHLLELRKESKGRWICTLLPISPTLLLLFVTRTMNLFMSFIVWRRRLQVVLKWRCLRINSLKLIVERMRVDAKERERWWRRPVPF